MPAWPMTLASTPAYVPASPALPHDNGGIKNTGGGMTLTSHSSQFLDLPQLYGHLPKVPAADTVSMLLRRNLLLLLLSTELTEEAYPRLYAHSPMAFGQAFVNISLSMAPRAAAPQALPLLRLCSIALQPPSLAFLHDLASLSYSATSL